MIEDVYEPAERYRAEFRDKFAKVVDETFDDLLKTSGVNREENRKTVAVIRSVEAHLAEVNKHISFLNFWKVLCIVLIVVGGCGILFIEMSSTAVAITNPDSPYFSWEIACIVGAILSIFFLFKTIRPRLKVAKEERDNVEAELEKNKQIAWAQMAPLNRLFDWDVTVRMISKTIPRIAFDPFFTAGRLGELHRSFDWDDNYNVDKSVLFAHSGEINGNPFVLGKTLYMYWGEKTYVGTRTISYVVRNGKNSYRRTETLRATVVKPFPEYTTDTFLLYGNDAAPNLTFDRESSKLADKEDSFWGKRRKKAEISKLKKFSRNLKDESQYTMMANEDFEALFNTMNRNDEVEFRLLFTPIAQQQMVKLLRNKQDGYGDDFSFDKIKKINVIHAEHLNALDLDNNPDRYKSYDLEGTRAEFVRYNKEYFRAIYFAFAPLLSIPLYQQTRTHENIYASNENKRSCFWEHEALANFYGEDKFAAANCATHSILKTEIRKELDGKTTLNVTANGFRAAQRVDQVRVFGGDGRYHLVNVPWDEYLDVSKTSPLRFEEDYQLSESPDMSAGDRANYIQKKEDSVAGSIYRRSMLSKWG